MDAALIAAAALMGLGGAPHCTAMCSAACSVTVRRCAPAHPGAASMSFLAGRAAGYAVAGALAAWLVSSLAQSLASAPLRALWSVFHMAALALGLWLVVVARQPAWLERIGVAAPVQTPARFAIVNGPVRAGAVGLAWFVLPCGLLQSALVMAALANGPLGGAAVMAAFALTSSVGLSLVPVIVRRWAAPRMQTTRSVGWAVRLAGVGLVATSGWALGHGVWQRIADLCGL